MTKEIIASTIPIQIEKLKQKGLITRFDKLVI